MKLFALLMALAAAPAMAASVTTPCKDPEYMQLKTGDKAELREEYCIAIRQAASEDRMHKIAEDTVAKKRELQIDATENEKDSMDYLKSAGTCRVRAAKFQVALSKRFKSKPPASCD